MQIGDNETAHKWFSKNNRATARPMHSQGNQQQELYRKRLVQRDITPQEAKPVAYARADARENTTSISVPECGPGLMWNCARLASTSALVSDRLTPAPSPAWSDSPWVRNGSSAAAA